MKSIPGALTHDLRANFFTRVFRTASVWADAASVGRLMTTPEHQEAVRRFQDWAADGAKTVTWTSESSEIDWLETMQHLDRHGRPIPVRLAS